MPFTIKTGGSFVSTGAAQQINVPSSCDKFVVKNLTQLATTQATGRGVGFEFYPATMAADSAIEEYKTNSTDALNKTVVTSGGFTYVQAAPQIGPAVVGTAITAANPAVVTMTNTFSNGQRVRLYNTTGMLQIAGMDFTISSVSGSGFTLLGLDASGFAAPATAVTARVIPSVQPVEPEFLYITAISLAQEAVIETSVQHQYVVGQKIHLSVPSSFGMVEADQQQVIITAVTAYTITTDMDSSAFTAFAFPASSASPGAVLFATLAPAGQSTQVDPITGAQTGYNFTYAPFHTGQFVPYMLLAAGAQSPAGSSGDLIEWECEKYEN